MPYKNNEDKKANYAKTKDIRNAGRRALRKKNNAAARRKDKQAELSKKRSDPQRMIMSKAKSCAKQRGIKWELGDPQEAVTRVHWPTHCPVLGYELNYNLLRQPRHQPNDASLDRRDSTKGYIPGNVFIISSRANRLKADATVQESWRIYYYVKSWKPPEPKPTEVTWELDDSPELTAKIAAVGPFWSYPVLQEQRTETGLVEAFAKAKQCNSA